MPASAFPTGRWSIVEGFPLTRPPMYAYAGTNPELLEVAGPPDASVDAWPCATLAGWMPWGDDLKGYGEERELLASQYVPSPAGTYPSVGNAFRDEPAALVVILHGCGQHSQAYAYAAGWLELADKYGWVLLLPQQTYAGNKRLCWNWFHPGAEEQGMEEARHIMEMIDTVSRQHWRSPPRVYITGLSAGGSMTAALLAHYPDRFVGGAVIAGLPFGCARDAEEAFQCMQQPRALPAEEWAHLVHEVSPNNDRWPRVSLWHGAKDTTVSPENLTQLILQWTAVHGVSATPVLDEVVKGGHWHRCYGEHPDHVAVEAYVVHDMPHGVPVDPAVSGDVRRDVGGDPKACGWVWRAGIWASQRIGRFWGIVPAPGEVSAGMYAPMAGAR